MYMKPNKLNASVNDRPVAFVEGAITNLKAIRERPDIVCWNMLFTEEIVALVSSLACV